MSSIVAFVPTPAQASHIKSLYFWSPMRKVEESNQEMALTLPPPHISSTTILIEADMIGTVPAHFTYVSVYVIYLIISENLNFFNRKEATKTFSTKEKFFLRDIFVHN